MRNNSQEILSCCQWKDLLLQFVVHVKIYHSPQRGKKIQFHIVDNYKLKHLLAFSFLGSKKPNSHTIFSGTANTFVWQLGGLQPQLSLHSHGVQRLFKKAVTCACQFSSQAKWNKKGPQAMGTLLFLVIFLSRHANTQVCCTCWQVSCWQDIKKVSMGKGKQNTQMRVMK